MSENSDIHKIVNYLFRKGYRVEDKPIGKGGFAEIYPAEKDGMKYVVRIIKLDIENAKEMVDRKNQINNILSEKNCGFMGFNRTTKCIDENIACTLDDYKKFGYYIEILKRYDMDLLSFIEKNAYSRKIMEEGNGNIKYIKNFNLIGGKLWKVLKVLHDKGIAHRDLKPENIMVIINDIGEIIDIVLIDWDTSCIGKEINNAIQCDPSELTLAYSTYEFKKINDSKIPYDINIAKKSDIYAMSLVVLLLWYGLEFNKFFDNNNSIKLEWFLQNLYDFTNPNMKEDIKIKRDKFLNNLKILNDTQLQKLKEKYGLIPDVITASHYIQSAEEVLNQIMNNKPVHIKLPGIQTGGDSTYYHKYMKYKNKYLQLKAIN